MAYTSNGGYFMKPQVAEFNTSQDSLRQLATMEWNLDEMFRNVYNNGIDQSDKVGIINLYHYLVFIYADRLFAFAWYQTKDEITKKENELTLLYQDWIKNNYHRIPTTLLTKMREYKRWLYQIKQDKLKLGVPTKAETTAHERMERAAGV